MMATGSSRVESILQHPEVVYQQVNESLSGGWRIHRVFCDVCDQRLAQTLCL